MTDKHQVQKHHKKQNSCQRPRTAARVAAVQALFQIEQNNDDEERVIQQFLEYRLRDTDPHNALYEEGHVFGADKALFQNIVRQATHNKEDFLKEIRRSLPKTWSLERIDPVLRAIFLAARGEWGFVAVPVLINEYVDIAHGFFSGTEPQLVNGLLDALFNSLSRQNQSKPMINGTREPPKTPLKTTE
ncbi:MAG: transcription antitermination factor NusB [Acetobacter sp.]|nr:transcription antitermination factor NusB [Acetobacter sp.]